jgi:hypothetical protein
MTFHKIIYTSYTAGPDKKHVENAGALYHNLYPKNNSEIKNKNSHWHKSISKKTKINISLFTSPVLKIDYFLQ